MSIRIRTVGPANPSGWVAFVEVSTASLGEVRVRCQYRPSGDRWVCEACGRQPQPTCIHAVHADDHFNR